MGCRAYTYIFARHLPFNSTILAGCLVLIFSRSFGRSVAALAAMMAWLVFVGVW